MVYPDNYELKVGFDRIRKITSDLCLSEMGRENCSQIVFSSSPEEVERRAGEVWEFQKILKLEDDFPIDNYYDLRPCLKKIRVEGAYPETSELYDLKRSLHTIKGIYNFIKNRNAEKDEFPLVGSICSEIRLYPFVFDSIDRILSKDGTIKDNASPELGRIRSDLKRLTASVSRKLQSILKQSQTDGIVEQGTTIALRNGRGVIPVGVYDKNKLRGLVHDHSATGKTVFIEPEEVVALNNQVAELEYSEKREIIKILVAFADLIRPYLDELLENYMILGTIDLVRARALLGNMINSVLPVLSSSREMEWTGAVHPLLFMTFENIGQRKVVPLDIHIDERDRIILISGPNAGGKSVCLKTVGLLQYMFQCGYTVPVSEGSLFMIFDDLFIDIGDEQSIDNDLSTYSSHLVNMKHFLKNSGTGSLVLIDEFGTGTEPMLGGAIAEAILSELNTNGVYGVITTHYTNLKHFASSAPGIVNGAMMFDSHRMEPLFRLDIGKPGSSFAFEIAKRIGLPDKVLEKASESIGEEHINFDRHLKDILRDKRYWEKRRDNIRRQGRKLDDLIADYENGVAELKKERKEILADAKEEAGKILSGANRVIENTIREIKESQAEKEKTREARKAIEEVKNDIGQESEEQLRIERKIKKLKEREKPIKREKHDSSKRPVREKEISKEISAGSFVLMEGSNSVGEVVRIKGKKATVIFGSVATTLPVEMLRHAGEDDIRRMRKGTERKAVLDWDDTMRRSRFKPEIDIRGKRADEALNIVRDLVDEAIVVSYPSVRILHGKGDGILRQIIREYLSTAPLVKTFRDENIEAGGSGITVVELDL